MCVPRRFKDGSIVYICRSVSVTLPPPSSVTHINFLFQIKYNSPTSEAVRAELLLSGFHIAPAENHTSVVHAISMVTKPTRSLSLSVTKYYLFYFQNSWM